MNGHEAIKNTIEMGKMVCMAYLGDMSDDELMQRPHADANHTKWQLGHLISAEHSMISGCLPGSMPELPEGFAEKYTKETTSTDDPAAFHSKEELLAAFEQQRSATLANLAKLSVDDLQQPAPEQMRDYAPTVGAAFNLQGGHWLMHAGQWAIVRRQLGKPIVI